MIGLVLAGGGSTRYGSPKPLARLDGSTFLELVHDALSRVVDRVCVSLRSPHGPVAEHARRVADCLVYDDPGLPCGGPAAALLSAPAREVLYASVDVPRVKPSTLAWLLDAYTSLGAASATLLWGDGSPAHMIGVAGPRALHVLRASCRAKGPKARLLDAYRLEGSLLAGWSLAASSPRELANYNTPRGDSGPPARLDRVYYSGDWFHPAALRAMLRGDPERAAVLLAREALYWRGLGLGAVAEAALREAARATGNAYIRVLA